MGLTSNIHFINIKDFSHLSSESKNKKKKNSIRFEIQIIIETINLYYKYINLGEH